MSIDTAFNAGNNFFIIPCHCVIAISIDDVDCDDKYRLLSNSEKKRADRFKSEVDRACYIVAHSLKRYCLAQLLNIPPEDLAFSSYEKGKPFCEHSSTVDFNLSHAAGWVLLGISSLANIGVDIEKSDRKISEKVINYALNDNQAFDLRESNNSAQKVINYWTQKEAISKCIGAGISIGFKNIECSGELNVGGAQCGDQRFLLQSYCFKGMTFSIANQSSNMVDVYYASHWSGNSDNAFQLEKVF